MVRSVALAALALACGAPALAADRSFPVGGFDRVSSSVPFDVRVRTGARPGVHASGSQEALDRLDIAVRGGELVVAMRRGGWFSGWRPGRGERARIDVTVPGLTAAALSGPGNLSVDRVRARGFTAALSGPGNLLIGQLEAGHTTLTLSGPGDLRVSGHAGSADVTLSGPGNVRAATLSVQDATLVLSGPGDIDITATRSASGHLSGPGDIRVTGGARCTISKTGPGSVRCG